MSNDVHVMGSKCIENLLCEVRIQLPEKISESCFEQELWQDTCAVVKSLKVVLQLQVLIVRVLTFYNYY